MLVSEMTALDLYSVIMTAFLIVGLSFFIIAFIRGCWFNLSIPQKILCVVGVLFLYAAPILMGFMAMYPY